MAPKKKAATKKGKTGLSRGRATKQKKEDTESVTGETTDDNVSEAPSSPARSERVEAKEPEQVLSAGSGAEEDPEEDRGWEQIPDLTEDFKNGDGKINYVTSTTKFREYELEERRKLRQDYFDLETLKTSMDASLRIARMYPEVRDTKVSDAIRELDFPKSFEELVARLMAIPAPAAASNINIQEPIFEESETEEEFSDAYGDNHQQSKRFPSPSKMARYQTPKNQGPSVYHFGTQGKGLSTNKAPRVAQPGEVVYSERGSPILSRRIGDGQAAERIEVPQPDGSKIEVDIVYRGAPDGSKMRTFKEFAKDIRGIAASRATSVRQNRVQPPKIKIGSQSAVSKSKKPDWR